MKRILGGSGVLVTTVLLLLANINRLEAQPIGNVDTGIKKCDVKADVGVLLDSSGSVREHYSKEKEFIMKIMNAYQLGEDQSRASVITFSLETELSIKFNEFYDQASFDQAVSDIPHMKSFTRIDLALQLAKSQMFTKANGARSGVPNTLILMTDGVQTTNEGAEQLDSVEIARELRSNGVNIIVVGISDGINRKALEEIAGNPNNLFTAENFDKLISDEFIKMLQVKTCQPGTNGNRHTNRHGSTTKKSQASAVKEEQ